MSAHDTTQLASLLTSERDTLLARWRQSVRQLRSARLLDSPTLNDHIPDLLSELVAALRHRFDGTIADALAEGSPPAHGRQRFQDGFDIEEVVAEYSILRGCMHDLADEHGLSLQGEPFRILNQVVDGAVALAVETYATQQALHVQRRREEYLAFVAHDLRTPLNAIALAARVLEHTMASMGLGAESRKMLATLHRNVHQLHGLVARILDENTNLRTEVGLKLERRTFDLWPLVQLLIHDLHPVADTGSTKLINQVPDDLLAYADAGLLRRVLQNLIANAIRYTPRGEIVIGARPLDNGSGIECWVSDNGAGIPPAHLAHIFDEAGGELPDGMGLGLAIVKTFVEAHSGQVWVESVVGGGSTFRFTLPGRDTSPE